MSDYRIMLANLSAWTRTGQDTIAADSRDRVLAIARGRSGVHVPLESFAVMLKDCGFRAVYVEGKWWINLPDTVLRSGGRKCIQGWDGGRNIL